MWRAETPLFCEKWKNNEMVLICLLFWQFFIILFCELKLTSFLQSKPTTILLPYIYFPQTGGTPPVKVLTRKTCWNFFKKVVDRGGAVCYYISRAARRRKHRKPHRYAVSSTLKIEQQRTNEPWNFNLKFQSTRFQTRNFWQKSVSKSNELKSFY